MAETVRILVDVDAKGTPKIQALERSFATLRRELEQTEFRSRRSAIAQIERSVAQTRNAIAAQRREFVNFAGQINRELVTIATRMTRTFAITAVAGIGAATAALVKMTGQFIKVNEEFRGLEITLRSSFKSLSIARQLRDEIAQITAFSPLPFQSIAQATRAFSVIPFTRNEIAQQVGGTGNVQDQNGFFRSMIRVVEQLVALRPDKTTGDAVFAIRELLTGEFRSLIRRFDVPISLLTSAGGKSILELKEDPRAAFSALQKGFGQLITPQAVEALARQPKILFENLIEQVIQIPLLRAGTLPLEGGKGEQGAFDTIIDGFFSTFLRLNEFVTNEIDPYARKIGQSLVSSFDVVTRSMGQALESILSLAGFGAEDILDQNLIGRSFSAITTAFEKLPTVLDKVIAKFNQVSTAILQLFQKISPALNQVYRLGESLLNLFIDSPATTAIFLLFSRTLPTIIGELFRDLSGRLATIWANEAVNPIVRGLNLNNIEPNLRALSEDQERQALRRNIRFGANGDAFLRSSAPSAFFTQFGVPRSGIPGVDTPLGQTDFRTRFGASGLDPNRVVDSVRFAQSGRLYLRNLGGIDQQLSQAIGAPARPGITGVQIGRDIARELSPLLNQYIERSGNQFRLAQNTPANIASAFGRNAVAGSIIASNIAAPIVAEGERRATERAEARARGSLGPAGNPALGSRLLAVVGSFGRSVLTFGASIGIWAVAAKGMEVAMNAWTAYQERERNRKLEPARALAQQLRTGGVNGDLGPIVPASENLATFRLFRDLNPDYNPTLNKDLLNKTVGAANIALRGPRQARSANARFYVDDETAAEDIVREAVLNRESRPTIKTLAQRIENSLKDQESLLALLDGQISDVSLLTTGEKFNIEQVIDGSATNQIASRVEILKSVIEEGVAAIRTVIPNFVADFTEAREKEFQTF